jgi:hypothetical protein
MDRQPAREWRLDSVHCKLMIRSYTGGVVIMKISGTDIGEFGDRPMTALGECLADNNPVRLFIDARDVRGASIGVSGDWAVWLRARKANLESVSMLTGSRYAEITAGFVRRFAELESIMRVYTEPEVFDAAVAQSLT